MCIRDRLLTGAVDMASGAATGAGSAVSKMGDTAMSLAKPGSKLQMLGAAASLAGSALSSMAEGASKLAKFGIEVLSKEVEKTVQSYNNMSRAGAMFADGMTGMRNSASQAGLTVEQMSKVVSENSVALAESGLGVGDATRKMGEVTAQLEKNVGTSGRSLRRELLQLGYSFEEQAGLAAEVMSDLRRSRSSLMGNDQAIAQQTAEYATNLRTISALTGEDAKTKMAEQRRQSTQVAFRLKLQELEEKQPGITRQVMESMTTMDEASRKAVMEQLTIGAVIDRSANVMMAGSEAYSSKVMGMAQLIESGTFSTEAAQRLQARANDAMQGDLRNFREIGIAGMTGALTDLNSAISGQIANMDRITADAVASSRQATNAQRTTQDQLTQDTIDAGVAAQNLKIALQDTLTPAIAQFSRVSKEMLTTVEQQLAKLGLGGGATPGAPQGPSLWDKMSSAAVGALEQGATGAALGATIGTVFPGIGNAVGATVGAVGGALVGALTGWFKAKEGKAIGGIAEGPASGYFEKLHGTEAVIPLSDNRSVPVQLDISGIGKTLAEMTSGMAPMTRGMATATAGAAGMGDIVGTAVGSDSSLLHEQIALLNEIRDVLVNSKDLQQQYVYNTYN